MSVKNFLKRHSRDPLVRRRAWNKYYERRIAKHDLHIYKGHLNWTIEPQLQALAAEWGDAPGIPADRLYFLYSTARMIAEQQIPGHTAECGVRYGKGSFYLLKALNDSTREHHLFDSFAGLSHGGDEDAPVAGVKTWAAGDIAVDEDTVRDNLAAFGNCRFHAGWIPERFTDVADARFAFVHIDVDLYQPTYDSLEFFYPRMAPGGLIVCDDYGFASCPGATRAFDEFFIDKPEAVLPIPSGQCLVWKSA